MRIVYGVVGEGMGHATRSRVVLEHLLQCGHEVRVVVSGRAHAFLRTSFAGRSGISIVEIHGLELSYRDNAVRWFDSLANNAVGAPRAVRKNLAAYRDVVEAAFRPEVVISDFESWAYLYGVTHGVPVISIDNMQVLNRCAHARELLQPGLDYRVARLAVKCKLPGAYHYLVTSFFGATIDKARTTLVPPILRPEVLLATPSMGEHIVVYQTAPEPERLLPALSALGQPFRVYGLNRDLHIDNVQLRPFSQQGFIEDLRTARGVIAGGGFSLMSEAVHLGVPVLSVPLAGHFEQQLNANYLAALGYGHTSAQLDRPAVERFLAELPQLRAAVAEYPRQGNHALFASLDRLLERVRAGLASDAPLRKSGLAMPRRTRGHGTSRRARSASSRTTAHGGARSA